MRFLNWSIPSRTRLLAVVPLLALIYYPALGGGFVFDDFPNIVNNPRLHVVSFDLQALWESLWGWQGRFSRPVSYLTFAINHYFTGLSPFAFKLTGLAIHAVNGLLLYLLLRRLLEKFGNRQGSNVAFFVALLWLVHPINLSTAVYVVQRMTALAALFVICGMLCFLAWRDRVACDNRLHGRWLLAVVLCAALAFLSKENGILLFAFIALMELSLTRREAMPPANSRTIAIVAYAPFAVLAVAALGVLLLAPDRLLGGYEYRPFTLPERVLTQSRLLFVYLENIIAPDLGALGLFLDDFPVSRSLVDPLTTVTSILGLILLGSGSVLGLRKFPAVSFGALFFLTGHLLESTVIPLEMAFEHRNYLPGAGILLSVTAGAQYLLKSADARRAILVLGVAAVSVFSVSTWVRATTWANPLIHMFFEVTHHPHSARANAEFGRLLTLAYNKDPTAGNAGNLLALAEEYLGRSLVADRISREGDYNLISLRYSTGSSVPEHEWQRLGNLLASGFVTHVDVKGLDMLVDCDRSGYCDIPGDHLEALLNSALGNSALGGVWRGKLLLVAVKFYSSRDQSADADAMLAQVHSLGMRLESVPLLIEVARYYGMSGNFDNRRQVLDVAVRLDNLQVYQEQIARERERLHE